MPNLNTEIQIPVTEKTNRRIREKLAAAVTRSPQENENWLFVQIKDETGSFHKTGKKTISAEIKIIGTVTSSEYEQMTAEIAQILKEELGAKETFVRISCEERRTQNTQGKKE